MRHHDLSMMVLSFYNCNNQNKTINKNMKNDSGLPACHVTMCIICNLVVKDDYEHFKM